MAQNSLRDLFGSCFFRCSVHCLPEFMAGRPQVPDIGICNPTVALGGPEILPNRWLHADGSEVVSASGTISKGAGLSLLDPYARIIFSSFNFGKVYIT